MADWNDLSTQPIDPGTLDPSLLIAPPGAGGYAGTTTIPNSAPSAASMALYASMGVSALGSIATAFSQASAQKAQGSYEASIANTNAALANLQSKQTLEAGDIMASRENLKGQQEVGSERAAEGASGTAVNSGSNLLTQNATNFVSNINQLQIKQNATRQAWGYQTEAIEDTYKGQFAELTAKTQSTQSLLTGGLGAIEGPLAIEANYLRWSRYQGGGAGGAGTPFPGAS